MPPKSIRSRRERLGLTQQELARQAKCSLSLVRMFDGGYAPATSPALKRVLDVLDKAEAVAAP